MQHSRKLLHSKVSSVKVCKRNFLLIKDTNIFNIEGNIPHQILQVHDMLEKVASHTADDVIVENGLITGFKGAG
jgi:hypothetical protein